MKNLENKGQGSKGSEPSNESEAKTREPRGKGIEKAGIRPQEEWEGINKAGIRPQEGQARDPETKEATPERKDATPDDLALVALERLATRQGARACQSLRSGKPTGKGAGWRMPVEVSTTSEIEGIAAAKYAAIRALHAAYGERWPSRVQWVTEYGPMTRRQLAFKRWLALTAWRGAFNDITQLPCGFTGRRSAGVRAMFVSLDAEQKEEATRHAFALFAPDAQDSAWLESSEQKEARRARAIRKAKRIVFECYLAPFAGKYDLNANDRRAKLAAIRRARVVGYLLDGQGAGMRSDNLKRTLKPLELPTRTGKRGQALGRSLVSQLARIKSPEQRRAYTANKAKRSSAWPFLVPGLVQVLA